MVKPILFNTEMVRAILDGRKTVTRRVVKPQPGEEIAYIWGGSNHGKWSFSPYSESRYEEHRTARDWKYWTPPYHADDFLYVRETWKKVCAEERYYENGEVVSSDELFGYKFRADNAIRWDIRSPRDDEFFLSEIIEAAKWRPSIHMPRETARIFLRVKNVRVERLQEIDGDGLRAEGFDIPYFPNELDNQFNKYGAIFDFEQAKKSFSALWDSTIKPADRERYGWAANPFCWVISFERISKDEAMQ